MKGGSRHRLDIGVSDDFVETIEGIGALCKIQEKEILEVQTCNNTEGDVYGITLKFTDGSTFNLLSKENDKLRGFTKLTFEFTEDIG